MPDVGSNVVKVYAVWIMYTIEPCVISVLKILFSVRASRALDLDCSDTKWCILREDIGGSGYTNSDQKYPGNRIQRGFHRTLNVMFYPKNNVFENTESGYVKLSAASFSILVCQRRYVRM